MEGGREEAEGKRKLKTVRTAQSEVQFLIQTICYFQNKFEDDSSSNTAKIDHSMEVKLLSVNTNDKMKYSNGKYDKPCS